MLNRFLLLAWILLVSLLANGCATGASLPPPRPEVLADLGRTDDLTLCDSYAREVSSSGSSSTAALAIRRELGTRRLPEAWEWQHIDRREVVPNMTIAGVTAIYSLDRSSVVGYKDVDGVVCPQRKYWVGGSRFKYGDPFLIVVFMEGQVRSVLKDDGTYLHQTGLTLDGSRDEIEKPTPAPVRASAVPSYPVDSGKVHVKGYYRKDGTYVRPHTRSKPKRK